MQIKDKLPGILVLAAGKGTRMHSSRPKVLQKLLGEPMLFYVLAAIGQWAPNAKIWIIAGHQQEMLAGAFPGFSYIRQVPQLGTGHALACALEDSAVAGMESLLILNGDVPLITAGTLQTFFEETKEVDLAFVSMQPEDPAQYGRVVRENGKPVAIVEAKDFEPGRFPEFSGEVNAGIYLFKPTAIRPLVSLLKNDNKSGEYYLTDLVRLAAEENLDVRGICLGQDDSLAGINTPFELARAEKILQKRINRKLQEQGVLIHWPELACIGPQAQINPGAEISGPCEILGNTLIESDCVIETNTVIKSSRIDKGSLIRSFSHLESVHIMQNAVIGPYSRLRPNTVIEAGARVGNFVELKKTILGKGAKASHLSYLGDSTIGANANIGAGTITCNYDGKNKFPTTIGENAFIGSNSALVAPVAIGKDALVGAGSVITRDVPAGEMAIARARQKNLPRRKK